MKIIVLCLFLFTSNYLNILEDKREIEILINCKVKNLSETKVTNIFKFQDYLVASFLASRDFQKYKNQIEHFVEALKENSEFDGYIIFTNSRQQSKRKTWIYANKLKLHLNKYYGVTSQRLTVKYGGRRQKSMFDLYVIPPKPKSQ